MIEAIPMDHPEHELYLLQHRMDQAAAAPRELRARGGMRRSGPRPRGERARRKEIALGHAVEDCAIRPAIARRRTLRATRHQRPSGPRRRGVDGLGAHYDPVQIDALFDPGVGGPVREFVNPVILILGMRRVLDKMRQVV